MFKRIFVILLITILVMSPVSVYASSAGSVTVASGSGSAVGGLFSDYGVNSKTSAIALTMVLLNSLGATVKLTDQAIQAGKKVQDVIMDKFAQWVGGSNAESMTEEQREKLKKRFKVINGGNGNNESGSDGPNIGPDGKVYFGLGALGILTEFIKYLKSKNDIQDYVESDPDIQTVNIGGYNTAYGHQVTEHAIGNSRSGWNYRSTVDCAICNINNTKAVFICNESFRCETYAIYKDKYQGSTYSTQYNNFHYSQVGLTDNFVFVFPEGTHTWPEGTTPQQLIDSITGFTPGTAPSDIPIDGIYKGENYDDSIIDNPSQPIVVDPGILPNITPDTDQQVSIPDYLQMILDNSNANAAQSQDPYNVPVTDPVTLSPGTLTVPVQEQDPINQPLPAETVAPEDVPVNPVQDPSTPVQPGEAMPRLTFPLDEYFPFCIPFDIYALLSKFTAEPVTPVFDVGFTEPFTDSEVNLHIDLTPWNGVATAIRTAELGAFIVGLALLSKQIFTRG